MLKYSSDTRFPHGTWYRGQITSKKCFKMKNSQVSKCWRELYVRPLDSNATRELSDAHCRKSRRGQKFGKFAAEHLAQLFWTRVAESDFAETIDRCKLRLKDVKLTISQLLWSKTLDTTMLQVRKRIREMSLLVKSWNFLAKSANMNSNALQGQQMTLPLQPAELQIDNIAQFRD